MPSEASSTDWVAEDFRCNDPLDVTQVAHYCVCFFLVTVTVLKTASRFYLRQSDSRSHFTLDVPGLAEAWTRRAQAGTASGDTAVQEREMPDIGTDFFTGI